jgi:hypothetical protein
VPLGALRCVAIHPKLREKLARGTRADLVPLDETSKPDVPIFNRSITERLPHVDILTVVPRRFLLPVTST